MFDKDCNAYWCDECGQEQHIIFAHSSQDKIVLNCRTAGCKAPGEVFSRTGTWKATPVEEVANGQG